MPSSCSQRRLSPPCCSGNGRGSQSPSWSRPSSTRHPAALPAVLRPLLAQCRATKRSQRERGVEIVYLISAACGVVLLVLSLLDRGAGVPRPLSPGHGGRLPSSAPSGSPPPAPAASLIARAAEVEDVRDLLENARLVTLTGPPGVGKTRLALEVCADRGRRDSGWTSHRSATPASCVPSWPGPRDLTPTTPPPNAWSCLDNCGHLSSRAGGGQLADRLRSTPGCGCWPPAGSAYGWRRARAPGAAAADADRRGHRRPPAARELPRSR